ncbi:MAG TPA: ribonuclease E/G, partial [Armatimonadota bacterium]|nr:ribonuclease E/G [Armatimonadota bacterium]
MARRSRRPESTTANSGAKEIIVNVSPREDRVAIIENGQLAELYIEREERVVGSIYKGKVVNVLPGMDAAFVDIGLEKNAFLYVGDILPSSEEEAEAVATEMEAGAAPPPPPPRRNGRRTGIKDVAKVGQQILVQVVKAPRGTKGARVSTRISLPGRYLVLMPDTDHVGVSRKIEDEAERERLKELARQVKPQGMGLIVRTMAEGAEKEELKEDLDALLQEWSRIQRKFRSKGSGPLIYRDHDLIYRILRDLYDPEQTEIIVDTKALQNRVQRELDDLDLP